MRHRGLRESDSQDAFTDVLFNVLLGFAFLFILSILLIDDSREEGKVSPKAEMLITVRWPDRHPDDVDTLVEGPGGELLWYNNRDAGLMHLDRDDRGRLADQVVLDGEKVSNFLRLTPASQFFPAALAFAAALDRASRDFFG